MNGMVGEIRAHYTSNPRLAKQFITRKEAAKAAVAIGWLRKDATAIDIMGFGLWAISDEQTRMLTVDGYNQLLADRVEG